MKLFFYLSMVLLGVISSSGEEIEDFINITKSGVYDFQNKEIFVKDKCNTPAIVIGDAFNEIPSYVIKDVVLKNVTIYGNEVNQDSEYHFKYSFLRNNGITIRGGQNIRVENVRVIGARSGGLVTEKHSSYINVSNSSFSNSFYDGVAACETTNSKFTNLIISHNKFAAISLDWRVENCIFENVLSFKNRDWTLFSRASKNNSFVNIHSFLNGGSYFLARNDNVVKFEVSSALWYGSNFFDFRAKSVEKCCFSSEKVKNIAENSQILPIGATNLEF
jgi:hypothetical protein